MEGQGDRRDLLFFVFHEGPAAIAIGDAPRQVYSKPLAQSVQGRRIVAGFDPFDVDDYELLWARFDGIRQHNRRTYGSSAWTAGFDVEFSGLEFGTSHQPPRPFWNARRR